MISGHIACSLRNLTRKKFRSGLTISGIAVGAASVILIASIGDMGKSAINDEINSLGIGSVIISSTSGLGDVSLGTPELDLIASQPFVEAAVPIMVDPTKIIMRRLTSDTVVWGIGSGAHQVISLEAAYGRLIDKHDIGAASRVCVVDRNVALAYYKRDNIVGKTMNILIGGAYHDFTVIGVVNSGGNMLQGLMGDLVPYFLYVPYSTMQKLSGKSGFDKIAVKVNEEYDAQQAGESITDMLDSRAGVKNAYKSENVQKQKQRLSNIVNIITAVLSAIAGISMVVAGLGIMTVMLSLVSERTREIGIKKSIGAKNYMILAEFVTEAFTMSAIGGIIGTVTGLIFVAVGCIPLGMPLIINTRLIFICIAFSIAIGVIFGSYPAMMASRMNPVDALRVE